VVWLVIFVALMIPLTAVVLDSPVVRSFVDRRGGGAADAPQDIKELTQKVGVIEAELEVVNRQLAQLQEEQQFLQRLIEDPAKTQGAPKSLPKPGT
jgi:hypothetical protein